MTLAERRELGQAARRATPRSSHGRWAPAADRPDPVALLTAQDAIRLPELVPIRWGRMSVSAFTYFRGSAAVMAADLAGSPNAGLMVQLCGDAHISNFGLFASPERALLFDVNDFDETLPGPFEWDVKRMAASAVIAARDNGFDAAAGRDAALAAVRSYREHLAVYAEMSTLDQWYSHVATEDLLAMVMAKGGTGKVVRAIAKKARGRDSLQALGKLAERADGRLQIINTPPLVIRLPVEDEQTARVVRQAFIDYRRTLQDDRKLLLERFKLVDLAHKIVGVGSVGTRCLIALLVGRDDNDPLFLQVKEAGRSVLEPFLGKSQFSNGGHRVVAGQRLMQATSDIFLGWVRGTGADARAFYFRQLRDMKGSLEISTLQPAGLSMYCEACGWALARAHARSGDAIAISAYLGTGDRFDRALADFAAAYADQMERDFEQITKAIADGVIKAQTGV
jgi:uncharacterized protein (DUF2252 family)